METPFRIVFDFNLDASDKVLHLEGQVTLKHSTPHYKVTKISRLDKNNMPDILPDIDVKCILSDGKYRWVHTDSGEETYLSRIIGQAIEKEQTPSVADAIGEEEHDF